MGVDVANKGSFSLTGRRSPGRIKGSTTKSTKAAREMIASFIDGNSERLQSWLDEIYQEDGARAAFGAFTDLIEYHVPKLARTEHVGADEGPIEIQMSWAEPK